MSLFKSSATISVLTLLSRIAGYVRDVLIAVMLGAGAISDAFFVAFRLPNIFRALFAEGAFNAAFIPMISKLKSKASAQDFAAKTFSILFFALALITILAQIFMPGLVWLLASGFAEDVEKFELAVQLTRITFGYLLFISLVSLLGGVLNSLGKFAAAAAAPFLLNLTLIGSLLLFADKAQTPAHALSWGVFAAGIVQFVWLYIACVRNDFQIKLGLPKISPEIKTLFKRMLPVMIGAGVLQINVLINTQIASHISNGAISYLYYADRISQFPLAIIGTAIGTALLPMLSKQLKGANKTEAMKTQNNAFKLAWFFAIPAAVGLAILAQPIISVLFEHGKFTAEDSAQVSKALIAYCVGIPAFILVKIFVPSFYANEDTKTPVQIGIGCILINLAVSLSLIHFYQFDHLALAISTSVSSWVNILLLVMILRRRNLFKFSQSALKESAKVVVASGLMGVGTCLAWQNLSAEMHIIWRLLAAIIIAKVIYFLLAKAFGLYNIFSLINPKRAK